MPPLESPIQLNDSQKSEWLRKRIERFKERYDALVAETGLCHAAILDLGPTGIEPLLLIIPKNPVKSKKLIDEITSPQPDDPST